MKYELQFRFKFREKLPTEAKEKIDGWIEEFHQILEKGIQEEDRKKISKITSWSIVSPNKDETDLAMTIKSGRVLPPHHALLRMRKFFAQKMGRNFRIGLAGIEFDSYEIQVDIPHKPREPFSLPFVKSIIFSEKKAELVLEKDIPIDFIEKGAIDRIVRLVQDKIKEEAIRGKDEHHLVIWSSDQKTPIVQENPTDLLIEGGWIERTSYRNQWIFAPPITAFAEALKRMMVEKIYEPLGFKNMMFPKLVSWEVWKRSSHLSGIYQGGFEPYFISPPKTADPKFWEEIADYYRITLEIQPEKIKEKLRPPIGGLSFAQCPPFWEYLQGKTISDDSFPILVYDWSGPTYRYESGSAHGFERVDELHRIETLYIGFPDQLKEIAQKLRTAFRQLLGETLDLEFREAWVTPWWTGPTEREERPRPAIDSFDQIGTIDMEVYLPYKGKRETSEWLETQNLSILGKKYPEGFTVKAQSGKELWSGCGGGSFERYVSAFVAQKGINPNDWPKSVVKYIDRLPEGPTFL
ncbi:MAG: serine--tRNA ligase [Candidatus Heimdallarchaeota archaeon]|nr:serine--tRNA ligase [Candidatus Heimdallarchaeota archaeon]